MGDAFSVPFILSCQYFILSSATLIIIIIIIKPALCSEEIFQVPQPFVMCHVLVWYKPHLTYPLRALWHTRPSQSLSRLLAAMIFTSSHDRHPASALSFSTVRLQVVFGLPLVLFPSGVQVIAMLQLLFWSCLSMWPTIFIYPASPLQSQVSCVLFLATLQQWSCHWILQDSSQALVMKYIH